MVCGILDIMISLFMHIQMRIGQERWMTGRVPVVEHSFGEEIGFLAKQETRGNISVYN